MNNDLPPISEKLAHRQFSSQVTLVIPGRNCASTLDRCLQSVVPLLSVVDLAKDSVTATARNTGSPRPAAGRGAGGEGLPECFLKEIIFVDDGSTDATPEIASRYPVRIIQGTGQGPGAARNLGWQASETELIWFIDSDCVAEPDALARLVAHVGVPASAGFVEYDPPEGGTPTVAGFVECDPPEGGTPTVAGFVECDPPEGGTPTVAGVGGSYANLFPDSLIATLIHEEIVARHRRMDREVDFLATFNVIYRRSVLAELGGFNEELKLAQDAEFAYRVRAAGHRLNFELESRVGHHHPRNLWRYLKTQARQGYYRIKLYRQHPTKITGDSYAGILDYLQPPLALVTLMFLPLCCLKARACVVVAISLFVLLLAQVPMAWRVFPGLSVRTILFVVFGTIRSFARGVGMATGMFAALTGISARNGGNYDKAIIAIPLKSCGGLSDER